MRRLLTSLVVGALALAAAGPARPGGPDGRDGPPNLLLDVSACLVDVAVRRPVDRVAPVDDVILETPVLGSARTVGEAHAELVPDPHCAVLDVVLDGTVYSRGVGYRRFVLLHTATTAPVAARYRVAVGGAAIQSAPGPVYARAFTTLLGVTTRRGETDTLATQLAALGFGQTREEAEAEVADHTAAQLSQQMGDDLALELNKASGAVGGALAKARQLGLDVRCLRLCTTADRLCAGVRIATPGQPAPNPAPAPPADTDLGVRLHQALVNETARQMLGGKKFTPEKLIQEADAFAKLNLWEGVAGADGGVPLLEKLLKALGRPVTLSLARQDPLAVSFTGGKIEVRLHVDKVRLGDTDLPGVRAKAVYRLEGSPEGVRAVRQGPVAVLQKDGLAVAAMRPVAEALFGRVLKDRLNLVVPPLPASGGGRAISLRASGAEARDGWLVLAWKLGAAR
jgi:hypothetical protein